MNGLDVLIYLRASGVRVDDALCDIVPQSAIRGLKCTKVSYVVDKLSDDKKGELARHFPDYYNRYPENSKQKHINELRQAFQMFVQKIILGKKAEKIPHFSAKQESSPDTLGEKIDTLITEIRGKWLYWSIDDGYRTILRDMKPLLPLLKQQYPNPMLQSDAAMMHEEITDVIPDGYISFLHDILIMLCTVYNIKVDQIRTDKSLWPENWELMNDIHHVASYLYHTLAWNIFDAIPLENKNSINYLARELISSLNTFYFALEEENMMQDRIQKNPPEQT